MKHYIDMVDEERHMSSHHPVSSEIFYAIKTILDDSVKHRAKVAKEDV